jgi:predicted small metal-binding protein
MSDDLDEVMNRVFGHMKEPKSPDGLSDVKNNLVRVWAKIDEIRKVVNQHSQFIRDVLKRLDEIEKKVN